MSDSASMVVHRPAAIAKIQRISPTIYEAALKCVARASWEASGDRHRIPAHPRALLGISAHSVFEHARGIGLLGASAEERARDAEGLFVEKAKKLFREAHPLIQAKFDTHEHIPYFNIHLARTGQQAARLAVRLRRASAPAEQRGSGRSTLVEAALVSKDGRVVGRPDVIDAPGGTIVDYKTGTTPDGERPTASEVRQLRLYASVAGENGIVIRKGVIERANGDRDEVEIARAEAEAEGRRAREMLREYNRQAGRPFEEAATPSAQACRYCPCVSFCPAFWHASEPSWEGECGVQLEGAVQVVEGNSLLSMHINASRGSGPRGEVVVTKLSRNWLTLNELDLPRRGDVVRVTDARRVAETASPTELRADRDMTAIWRM